MVDIRVSNSSNNSVIKNAQRKRDKRLFRKNRKNSYSSRLYNMQINDNNFKVGVRRMTKLSYFEWCEKNKTTDRKKYEEYLKK